MTDVDGTGSAKTGNGTRADLVIDGLTGLSLVGVGASARVYRAEEADFGRSVAVKVFDALDSNGVRWLERERELMGQVDSHPNVWGPDGPPPPSDVTPPD